MITLDRKMSQSNNSKELCVVLGAALCQGAKSKTVGNDSIIIPQVTDLYFISGLVRHDWS